MSKTQTSSRLREKVDRRNKAAKSKIRVGRSHERLQCDLPTKSWHSATHKYLDLNVLNVSPSGLYVELEERLPLKSHLDIFFDEDGTFPEALIKGKQLKARIMWSGKSPSGSGFGAGVQILEKSSSIENQHAGKLLCCCDLCSRMTFYKKVCQTEECVYLCQSCFRLFPKLPEGIKKYLLGNIY